MNKPIEPLLQQLLPELFSNTDKKPLPGGMCAPGSGCGPRQPGGQGNPAFRLFPPIPNPSGRKPSNE